MQVVLALTAAISLGGSRLVVGGALEQGVRLVRTTVNKSPLAGVAVSFAAGCAVGSIVAPAAKNALAIYPTVEDISARAFRQRTTLKCKVIKVADGDTYRVAHVPIFSALRRSPAMKSKAEGGRRGRFARGTARSPSRHLPFSRPSAFSARRGSAASISESAACTAHGVAGTGEFGDVAAH